MRSSHYFFGAAIAVALSTSLAAQEAVRPTVEEDGTIRGSVTRVPMSSFLSEEIKAEFTRRLRDSSAPSMKDGMAEARLSMHAYCIGRVCLFFFGGPSVRLSGKN